MTEGNPQLYPKSAEEVAAALAAALRGAAPPNKWQVTEGGILAGSTQLFGRLSQIIISRLNEMPEQHFRAFLNEAEIDRLPPQPGRTEITFLPAPDGMAVIPAPAGTQVATRAAGDQPELIFETERPITVTPAALKACVVVDPVKYRDCTTQARGETNGSFPAFVGDTERERILYLGDDAMLAFADEASRRHGMVTIAFTPAQASALAARTSLSGQPAPENRWQLRWLYWDGKAWRELAAAGAEIVPDLHWFDCDGAASDQSSVTISNLPALTPVEVNGATTLWLGAQVTGGAGRDCLPTLADIQLTQTIHVPDTCAGKVDAAYAAIQGGKIFVPLNLQSPFQPLGPQPGTLDTFYLRMDDALSKEKAQVTITLTLPDLPKELDDTSEIDQLKVTWEYYSNEGWTELGYSRRGCPVLEKYSFDSTAFDRPTLETNFLTRQKYLEFAVPAKYGEGPLPPPFTDERQVKDIYTGKRYVQIPVPDPCKNLDPELLINGGYTSARPDLEFRDKTCALTTAGIVQFRVPQDAKRRFAKVEVNGQMGYWVRARLAGGSYNVPRSVRRLLGQRIDLPPEVHAPVVTQLAVTFAEYSLTLGPSRPQYCRSCVDKGWRDLRRELEAGRTIAPFSGTIEGQALYAGFMPLAEGNGRTAFPPGAWLQLRLEVDEGQQLVETPEVAYEYWNGAAWSELRGVDGTFGLRRTGYLGFYAPDDHAASLEFGRQAYWLRIKPAARAGEIAPRLGTIRLNTVGAVNAKTYRDEVLGSSTGKENQRFALAHTPVLPDLQLEVLERDVGDDAAHETWVKWTRVDSFYACGSDSRCYMLDQAGGLVLFGDGHAGKIPPPGIDNIRAARYRTHAGQIGNASARAVSDLRTTQGALGNVDRVANYEPCSGGVDVETMSQVKRRGPQALKHRGRAVTQEDIEWLGMETGGVERLYPLAATGPDGSVQPGWITAVIVPRVAADLRAGERPAPSPALLRQVRAYLEERVLANLAAGQVADGIHLCGPDYVEVRVTATVVTRSVEVADEIKLAVMRQLEAFLHPLTGGPQRTGWILGRDVYVSEVAAEIENVPGVDHVAAIGLSAPNLLLWRLTLDQFVPAYDLPGGSQASLIDESIKLKLAEPAAKQVRTEGLAVYAFEAPTTAWLIDSRTGAPVTQVQIAAVDAKRALVEFAQPLEATTPAAQCALRALDGCIQLPVQDWQRTRDEAGKLHITGALLQMLAPGDRISLVHAQQRNRLQFPVTVLGVTPGDNLARIYVPARYLVCSGSHAIRMVLENEDGNSTARPG